MLSHQQRLPRNHFKADPNPNPYPNPNPNPNPWYPLLQLVEGKNP